MSEKSIKDKLAAAAEALGLADTYDGLGVGEKSVMLRSQRVVKVPKFSESSRLQKRVIGDALRDCESVLNRFGYGLSKSAVEELPR